MSLSLVWSMKSNSIPEPTQVTMHQSIRTILVTGRLPEIAQDQLALYGKLITHKKPDPISNQELMKRVKEADALISFLYDQIDRRIIESAPRLRIIANAAAGFNNVDTAAAQEHGIWVTNTPGVLTEATADLTMGLLLCVSRHIVSADRFLREGRFHGWDFHLFWGSQLHGKTLGIIGMGRIGQAVAERAKGFGLKILYHNPLRLSSEQEKELSARHTTLSKLLRQSDFVSLHVPLTSTTHHMIASPQFSIMKPTAVLINTARGPVVDEKDLVDALQSKRIAGAGLDVFEEEPTVEKGLKSLDNVVLLPHIGSATVEARMGIALTAVRNVVAVLQGKRPPNPVVIPEKRIRG
jgi:glyoxylate reductase